MNAKRFLKQVEKLDTTAKNKLIERQQWADLAQSITAQMDSERVQSSGSQQKMADALNMCLDMVAEIVQTIAQLADQKRKVTSTIEQLNATEYDVLHKVYVQYMTIAEVAVDKGMSKSWAKNVHNSAIDNLQKILDGKEIKDGCTY